MRRYGKHTNLHREHEVVTAPPHLRTSAPPHLRTSAPPHLRTSAPPPSARLFFLRIHVEMPIVPALCSRAVETWELAAREHIRDLVAAYAHFADSGRFDELVALFADDGVLETPDGRRHRGADALRAFLTATKHHLAAATAVPLIRHHVSNLRIEVTEHEAASGTAYFLVVTERGPDHWGRYRDRYVCRADVWRFAHRRVRLDGYAPGSWAAHNRGESP